MRSAYEPVQDQDRDQPNQREQWFQHGRTIPGQSAAALRYRSHLQKMQLRAARASGANEVSPDAGTTWTALGPAPLASDATGFGGQDYDWVSGRATAVAADPADLTGNTVYVGGAYGGVWKSTNAGPFSPNPSSVTWAPLTDTQATLAVGSIAIQPGNTDPNRSLVLVGTGETNSSVDSYYGLGILRSTDAGNTWTLIMQDSTGTRPFAGMGFSKIAFSTANPSLVVAAAAGASQGEIEGLENPDTVNRGIYYSTNAGISWSYASITDGGVTVAPGSVTAVAYNPTVGKFFAAVRYHGFYSSSDGVNWSRLTNQPGAGLTTAACPANPASGNCPIYRGEFAVLHDPANPSRNEMYVWYVDSSSNDEGLWKTTNSGTSWTLLTETGITNCGDLLGCGTAQGLYNLELAAVPNGMATDLYAGAVNLFKCQINDLSPTCGGTGSNTFLNLTHVYGCAPNFGSIARVHPDQHSLDFMVVNSKAIMYFANDGGLYRALDAYTGLITGTRGGSNQFDSLNQTLGSMTQFVSFSQHPSDANTILGGTQDNGSPATALSQVGTSWLNVNSADGGYNEINPDDPTEWFTSNTNVSIQRCTAGITCHAQDFLEVVTSATVGGDTGPFYTPYILDPQNSGEFLVGTCRIWRGTTMGTGFTALSSSFETGGDGICSGTEINLVRSVAAGGIKDTNGLSNVIYAGTDGFGPLIPTGGHVWVSTNVAGGSSTWNDQTQNINPGAFPVSSVAIDTADTLGLTAYVTIMGFHVSHVWKTSNGGGSWTDFTANLPDAPANAVLVDSGPTPDTGTVYVATDVGVFSSNTATANWIEAGPAPGSGQDGYLPNVAVTALRMFNTGRTKKLRASTYGRGMWEFNLITIPDFQIGFASSTQTAFAPQNATFNGTLTAFNGYASQVTLTCTTGVPSLPNPCTPNPSKVTPLPAGKAFTVAAGGAIGDYSFVLHGVGSDTDLVTHDASLTLHVVDFGLTAPVPASVTVNVPNASQAISFQATAKGSFHGTVNLSCVGLPADAACNFSPSSSVNPTSSSPVAVTLTISTSVSTPSGTFPVTISATTAGAPTARTQNLTLTVTDGPDYTLTISNPAQSALVGASATFSGILTSFKGYSSTVNLSCGAGAPPTCTAPSVKPTPSGTPFTVTTSSSVVGTYGFNVVGQGTDPSKITHSAAVNFSSTFDFSITNKSSAPTISAGQSATYNLDVKPLGSNFPNSVALTFSDCPEGSTCSFDKAQIAAGGGDTPIAVNIRTTAPVVSSNRFQRPNRLPLYGIWLPLPGLALIFSGLRRRAANRTRLALVRLVGIALLVGVQVACGGGGAGNSSDVRGGQIGTPPGTYQVTVTATSGALSHHVLLTLTVQ